MELRNSEARATRLPVLQFPSFCGRKQSRASYDSALRTSRSVNRLVGRRRIHLGPRLRFQVHGRVRSGYKLHGDTGLVEGNVTGSHDTYEGHEEQIGSDGIQNAGRVRMESDRVCCRLEAFLLYQDKDGVIAANAGLDGSFANELVIDPDLRVGRVSDLDGDGLMGRFENGATGGQEQEQWEETAQEDFHVACFGEFLREEKKPRAAGKRRQQRAETTPPGPERDYAKLITS